MLCTNLVVKQLYTDVQLLNSLFQKAYGKGIIPYVPLLKILNVSERTRMSVVPRSSDVFALFNRASTASLCQKRVPLYAFQHHIAERFISYTCNENRIVVA